MTRNPRWRLRPHDPARILALSRGSGLSPLVAQLLINRGIDDPRRATSFLVGMLHGVGAETPTQVLVFVAAAGAGGRVAGVLLLVAFVAGLLASNTLIAATSTVGFLNATRSFAVYAGVAVLTGTFSLAIGSMFLSGRSTLLPAIFGG